MASPVRSRNSLSMPSQSCSGCPLARILCRISQRRRPSSVCGTKDVPEGRSPVVSIRPNGKAFGFVCATTGIEREFRGSCIGRIPRANVNQFYHYSSRGPSCQGNDVKKPVFDTQKGALARLPWNECFPEHFLAVLIVPQSTYLTEQA